MFDKRSLINNFVRQEHKVEVSKFEFYHQNNNNTVFSAKPFNKRIQNSQIVQTLILEHSRN